MTRRQSSASIRPRQPTVGSVPGARTYAIRRAGDPHHGSVSSSGNVPTGVDRADVEFREQVPEMLQTHRFHEVPIEPGVHASDDILLLTVSGQREERGALLWRS